LAVEVGVLMILLVFTFAVSFVASTHEQRGDFVQNVDCFAGGALFGFGVACCWVCGGWHFEKLLCLWVVVVVVCLATGSS
jgi:hypothetical protein